MSDWRILPSYKMDLACFCNLFFQDEMGIERHREGYERFRSVIEGRQDLIDLAKTLLSQGIMIGGSAATILSLVDYNGEDIDEICKIFEDKSMYCIIRDYVMGQGALYEIYERMEPMLPIIGGGFALCSYQWIS